MGVTVDREAREASGDVARLWWLGLVPAVGVECRGGGGDGVEGGLGVDGQADQADQSQHKILLMWIERGPQPLPRRARR